MIAILIPKHIRSTKTEKLFPYSRAVTLKTGRREGARFKYPCACRPSHSEFSVVFSEIRVNTDQDPLERHPRRALPLQAQIAQTVNSPLPYNPTQLCCLSLPDNKFSFSFLFFFSLTFFFHHMEKDHILPKCDIMRINKTCKTHSESLFPLAEKKRYATITKTKVRLVSVVCLLHLLKKKKKTFFPNASCQFYFLGVSRNFLNIC